MANETSGAQDPLRAERIEQFKRKGLSDGEAEYAADMVMPGQAPPLTYEQAVAAAGAMQEERNRQAAEDAQPLTVGGMKAVLAKHLPQVASPTAQQQEQAARVAAHKTTGLSDGEADFASRMKLPG